MLLCNTHIYNLPKKYSRYAALQILRCQTPVTEHKVKAITGKDIPIEADSICLHGDSPKAVLFAEKISAALKAAGVEIAPMADVIG